MNNQANKEIAIFAGGCFWCTEAIFKRIKGVIKVPPGYVGGTNKKPTYEQVTSGSIGHAEAIQIIFNSKKISYIELLEFFFSTHDSTSLNQQGNDVGTQYRSAIFYTTQKELAKNYIKFLEKKHVYSKNIVTEIRPLNKFYVAEIYHHNYFELNPDNSYCQFVIFPKIEKIKK